MKDITLSYVIEAEPSTIIEHLTPERIVEYMGYSIVQTKSTSDAEVVLGQKSDIELQLSFRERDNGYQFSQHGQHGPYEKMNANLWVEQESDIDTDIVAARVTVYLSYTFGSMFSFIVDWLGRSTVKSEVEWLLSNLTRSVVDQSSECPDGADS